MLGIDFAIKTHEQWAILQLWSDNQTKYDARTRTYLRIVVQCLTLVVPTLRIVIPEEEVEDPSRRILTARDSLIRALVYPFDDWGYCVNAADVLPKEQEGRQFPICKIRGAIFNAEQASGRRTFHTIPCHDARALMGWLGAFEL